MMVGRYRNPNELKINESYTERTSSFMVSYRVRLKWLDNFNEFSTQNKERNLYQYMSANA